MAASRLSCRKNSNTLPENVFLPLRVTTLMAAPELRPYSAEKFDVWILTSSMKSMPTLLIWLPLLPESRLLPPSTVRLFDSPRLPLIDWPVTLRLVARSSWSLLVTTAPGMSEASCR